MVYGLPYVWFIIHMVYYPTIGYVAVTMCYKDLPYFGQPILGETGWYSYGTTC